MGEESNFKVSQDYEIVPPQKKRVYLILVEEWDFIKGQVSALKDNTNFWHTLGSILLGVAGSGLLSAMTLDIPIPEGDKRMPMPILISWGAFVITGLTGGLSMFFAKAQRKVDEKTAGNAVAQMELIEKRFQREDRNV
jgi:hypothetical protein